MLLLRLPWKIVSHRFGLLAVCMPSGVVLHGSMCPAGLRQHKALSTGIISKLHSRDQKGPSVLIRKAVAATDEEEANAPQPSPALAYAQAVHAAQMPNPAINIDPMCGLIPHLCWVA